jgi:hypothetical protein
MEGAMDDQRELTPAEFDQVAGMEHIGVDGEIRIPCGHFGFAPERMCKACYETAKLAAGDAETIEGIWLANPRTFAPELIEQAKGEQLTATELAETRRLPTLALQRAGLGALVPIPPA